MQTAQNIITLVSARAEATPQSLALAASYEVLTFGELETKSNQVAGALIGLGARAGQAVALLTRRSPGAAVGALGILKAGGACLPLDRSHAAERLAYQLIDARVEVVLTDDHSAARVPEGPWKVVSVDGAEVASHSGTAPQVAIDPQQLAYVMYTSGSAERPKSVLVTHANLTNLIEWHDQAFHVTAGDRASQVTSLAIDAAVWEMWPCLGAGGSVHFAPESVRTDPDALRNWLIAEQINISFVPTALAIRGGATHTLVNLQSAAASL